MSRFIDYFRRNLSIRVSLSVVVFAALIFVAALSFLFLRARDAVREEAVNRATQILDKTSLQVEGILNRVEVATSMTEWLVQRHPDNPDSMFVYSRGMLMNNPDFYNCSIAFEPYYFEKWGRYFSAYSKHDGSGIRTIQGGSDNYQYFYMDWYLMAKLLDRPCWTEPYMDLDVPTNTSEMVSSYCTPIKDAGGNLVGVINTSLSLSWLSETISALKPYPHSFSIMIGRGGTYFVHPDPAKISRETIFTRTLENRDMPAADLGHAMQRGEEGMMRAKVDGVNCYVFYKPLGKTGCSMAIICPEKDVFGGFDRLRRAIIMIVVLGLLLMLFLFIQIITRELSPLRRLADGAETIASGKLDAELPELGRIDEIGQLSHSFGNMQKSLVKYIDELKDTTAQKASIERDLHIASRIQMGMLPKNFPERIYATLTPAKDVGGDLFDFHYRDGKLFFCIGDVSGKGVPASLFMAVAVNLFRVAVNQQLPPAEIATQLNNVLSEKNEKGMFVTMFIGVADLQTGHLDFCNAGHNPAIVKDLDGNARFIEMDPNAPLGLWPGLDYVGESIDDISMQPFFIYSDGLNEAENVEQEQFGDDHLLELWQDRTYESAEQTVRMLNEAVEKHANGAEQSDDLTMLCLRVAGNRRIQVKS